METYHVVMTGTVTLIYSSDDRKCWLIESRNPDAVAEEPIPQMYNAHLSPHYEKFEIEDEHPFPRARELFKKKIAAVNLIGMTFASIDPLISFDDKLEAAKSTVGIVASEHGEHALLEAEKYFSDTSLDLRLFVFHRGILEVMDPKLYILLRDVYRKKYGLAIPIKT